MKKSLTILVLAASFATASLVNADTLPAGATRFHAIPGAALTLDIPKGKVLVITDVVGTCTLRDGEVNKVPASSSVLYFQTGVEFATQLQAGCSDFRGGMLSGY